METKKSFLVIHNISKSKNVGSLLRSAAAFGVEEVWVIGSHKLKTFGNQGTAKRLRYRYFESFSHLQTYAFENSVAVCGVEITETSQSIWNQPFKGSTAFILGNEGVGLSAKEKEICELFVYIPQYSSNTESLNVNVAGAICLSHFANWAGFAESPIEGEKFKLQDPFGREANAKMAEEVREARKNKQDSEFLGDFDIEYL